MYIVKTLNSDLHKFCSARLIEGIVYSLVEDNHGNVVGVNYKEKESKCDKV